MTIKKTILFAICVCTLSTYAQEKMERFGNFSVGVHFGEVKQDFGMGVNITSPYFSNEMLAVRFAANQYIMEYIPIGEDKYAQSGYSTLKLGLVLRNPNIAIAEVLFPYVDMGLSGIIPNKKLSEKDFLFGAHFVLGSELKPKWGGLSLFAEMGICNTGNKARAEKAVASPFYGSGFQFSFGTRYYFK